MFPCYGKIVSSGASQKPGWYYLSIDPDIGLYYGKLWSKGNKPWNLPLNGPHITFISGEKDKRIVSIDEMKDYLGLLIEFAYNPIIKTNGRAFWIDVNIPSLNDIRMKLGLGVYYRSSFHLTLGNIK